MGDVWPKQQLIVINEIYGPVPQGEGINVGLPSVFLRLGGCNLRCIWCDTKYTWDWYRYDSQEELHPKTIDEVYDAVCTLGQFANVRHVVVTGGEPMLQQRTLTPLMQRLYGDGWTSEIETAGTIKPQSYYLATQFNVSPKLANSLNSLHRRYKPDVLAYFVAHQKAYFKFVVEQTSDFEEVDKLVQDLAIPLARVIIMPEGFTAASQINRLRQLEKATLERGYRLIPRLHTLIHDKARKV